MSIDPSSSHKLLNDSSPLQEWSLQSAVFKLSFYDKWKFEMPTVAVCETWNTSLIR